MINPQILCHWYTNKFEVKLQREVKNVNNSPTEEISHWVHVCATGETYTSIVEIPEEYTAEIPALKNFLILRDGTGYPSFVPAPNPFKQWVEFLSDNKTIKKTISVYQHDDSILWEVFDQTINVKWQTGFTMFTPPSKGSGKLKYLFAVSLANKTPEHKLYHKSLFDDRFDQNLARNNYLYPGFFTDHPYRPSPNFDLAGQISYIQQSRFKKFKIENNKIYIKIEHKLELFSHLSHNKLKRIDENKWAITLINAGTSKMDVDDPLEAGHAAVIIEGISNGKRFTKMGHLTAEAPKIKEISGSVRFLDKTKTWIRTRQLAEAMCNQIASDEIAAHLAKQQKKPSPISFSLTGVFNPNCIMYLKEDIMPIAKIKILEPFDVVAGEVERFNDRVSKGKFSSLGDQFRSWLNVGADFFKLVSLTPVVNIPRKFILYNTSENLKKLKKEKPHLFNSHLY